MMMFPRHGMNPQNGKTNKPRLLRGAPIALQRWACVRPAVSQKARDVNKGLLPQNLTGVAVTLQEGSEQEGAL